MRTWRRIGLTMGLAGTIAFAGGGCFSRPDTAVRGYRSAPPSNAPPPAVRDEGGAGYRIPVHSNTPQGQDLCDRLMLASDGILGDAQIRDNRDLYVVLGPKANVDQVPTLVRSLVVIMNRSFPKEDVTVRVHDRAGQALVNASVDVSQGIVTYEFPR